MLNASEVKSYADFNGLAALKREAKAKTPEAIEQVAKQFEAVFINMVMKSMRQAKLAEGLLESSQSEFYQDMYDKELSVHLSGKQGLGLAEVIVKQLTPSTATDINQHQQISDYQRRLLIKPMMPIQDHGLKENVLAVLDRVSNTVAIEERQDKPIESVADFIQQLRPYAQNAAQQLGVDADMLLAQVALETGWGKSIIQSHTGGSSHNLFNIKANKSWQGQQTSVNTLEFREGIAKKERAGFRAYESYQDSFDDYVQFIKTNPRYATAIQHVDQPEQYMRELQQAGYATDPRYADKIIQIYQQRTRTDNI